MSIFSHKHREDILIIEPSSVDSSNRAPVLEPTFVTSQTVFV